jgi:hypothetical protein
MNGDVKGPRIASFLLLRRSRALLARPRYRRAALGVAVCYGLLALVLGDMLTVSTSAFQVESYVAVVAGGTPWWNFPALLVETPNFVLALPFLPTLVMVLLSIAVGLGMTVAALLIAEQVRGRQAGARGLTTVSLAGMSPALVALVTLGACCSTAAGASAGVLLLHAVSGSSATSALANVWYLGFFQLGIVWAGLLAQEQLVTVYRGLTPGIPATLGTSSEHSVG